MIVSDQDMNMKCYFEENMNLTLHQLCCTQHACDKFNALLCAAVNCMNCDIQGLIT